MGSEMRSLPLACLALLAVAAIASVDGAEVAPTAAVHELGEMKEEPKEMAKQEKADPEAKAKDSAEKADPEAEAKGAPEETAAAAGAGGGGIDALAGKANQKAELALTKIKTAKELRTKARAVLTAKGKPIPDILKKGALDDVHQRVLDARSKLHSKFGMSPKNDGELEAKAQEKREAAPAPAAQAPAKVNTMSAEYEAEKVKAQAEKKKAAMYKKKYKEANKKEKQTAGAAKTKMQALQQKAEMDKKLAQTQMNGKVSEIEAKMKEKAEAKMQGVGTTEGDEDFNHRQIAQEAYNKQVMGYVMAWEKTHGGPAVPSRQEEAIKDDLANFVSHYEKQHADITGSIQVADSPTRR